VGNGEKSGSLAQEAPRPARRAGDRSHDPHGRGRRLFRFAQAL